MLSLGLSDGFLGDYGSVQMGLEIMNLLAELDNFISAGRAIVFLARLNFVELVRDVFEIFDHAVESVFLFEIGFVDEANVDLPVVANRLPQRLEVGIHEVRKLVDPIVKHLEVREHRLLDRFLDFFDFVHGSGLVRFQQLVQL